MVNSKLSIKTVVSIGIGSAVFMLLGRFGAIPTGIPNTNIETAYVFLALMALLYGPIAGISIGFIGHALKDALFYGTPWISWILASSVIGLIIGFASKKINTENFNIKEIIKFNIVQIISNIIAWIIIAPTLDMFIYGEPLNKVYIQGSFACISNILTVSIIGTSIIKLYSKTLVKKGSLSKEL